MTVRRRPDGGWQIDVVVRRDGERFRHREAAKVRNRSEALAKEREVRAKIEERATLRLVREAFADFSKTFLETYVASNNKPSERESKESILRLHLVPFFGHLRLDQIGPEDVERFKALNLRSAEPKTVNNRLGVLRRMLSLAHEWGRIGRFPKIKFCKLPPQEFDFFTAEEGARLVSGALPGMWQTMILLGLRTGLRQGEILELRWGDVDLVARRVHVQRNVSRGVVGTPKGGRPRHVPLSAEMVAALRKLPSRLRDDVVFDYGKGQRVTKGEAKRPLWNACRAAGLRRVGWHVLRHSFASQLVIAGVPLKAVQELLGHSTIEQTMRYAHLSPDVAIDAVAKLDFGSGHGRVTFQDETSRKAG